MSSQNEISEAKPTIEEELGRLTVMPITDLRKRYRELFRAAPPKSLRPRSLTSQYRPCRSGEGIWRPSLIHPADT